MNLYCTTKMLNTQILLVPIVFAIFKQEELNDWVEEAFGGADQALLS